MLKTSVQTTMKFLFKNHERVLSLEVYSFNNTLIKKKLVTTGTLRRMAKKAQELGLGVYRYKKHYYNFYNDSGAKVRFDHGSQCAFQIAGVVL